MLNWLRGPVEREHGLIVAGPSVWMTLLVLVRHIKRSFADVYSCLGALTMIMKGHSSRVTTMLWDVTPWLMIKKEDITY